MRQWAVYTGEIAIWCLSAPRKRSSIRKGHLSGFSEAAAIVGHVQPQFLQPGISDGVAGCAPVAAGRQRSAGADFGRIGKGRALELAELEEAVEKDCEPLLDGGEKINPYIVEAELGRDPLFGQVVVAGDRRPFLVAIIALNASSWQRFAAENGLDPDQPNHALSKVKLLTRAVTLLSGLPRHAQVQALHLTLEPWTIEAGQLTPTLKIKRDVILRLFAREIEQLYAQPDGL